MHYVWIDQRLMAADASNMQNKWAFQDCDDPGFGVRLLLISCTATSLCLAGCQVRNKSEQLYTWAKDQVVSCLRMQLRGQALKEWGGVGWGAV